MTGERSLSSRRSVIQSISSAAGERRCLKEPALLLFIHRRSETAISAAFSLRKQNLVRNRRLNCF